MLKNWLQKYILMSILIYISQIVLIYFNLGKINLQFYLLIPVYILYFTGWILFFKLWKFDKIKKIKYFGFFCLIITMLLSFEFVFYYFILENKLQLSGFMAKFGFLFVAILGLYSSFKEYQKYNKKGHKRERKLYNKAVKFYKKEDYDRALKYFNKLEDEYFKLDFYRFKGGIYLKKNENKKAIEELTKAISYRYGDSNLGISSNYRNLAIADTYRNLAIAHFRLDNEKKSLEYNLKAHEYFIKEDEKEVFLDKYLANLMSIAKQYYEKEDFEQATYYLQKLVELDIKYQGALYFLGYLQLKNGDLKEAENNFIKDLEYFPEHKLNVFYNLILIYTKLKDREKVWDYLIEGTEESYDFYITYNWSTNTFNDNQKEELLSYLEEEYKNIKKSGIDIYDVIIYLKFELNQNKEAEDYIKKMTNDIGEHNHVYYWKIISELKKENYKEARRLYKDVIEIKPNFIELHDWVEIDLKKEEIEKVLIAED